MIRIESIRETFKDNLNKLLIEKGVTQKALADFVGVSTATVSDWKKGKKLPRMDKVDKICQFFHIDRKELVETVTSNGVMKTGCDLPNAEQVYFDYTVKAPPPNHTEDIDFGSIMQELKNTQKALATISRVKRPTITEAEQALLDAYRNAPADKKTIVNLTLGLK